MSKRHSIRIVAGAYAALSRVFLDGEQLDCVTAARVEVDARNPARVVLTLEPHEVIVEGDNLKVIAQVPVEAVAP